MSFHRMLFWQLTDKHLHRSIVDELKVGADSYDTVEVAAGKSRAEAISLAWSSDGQVLFVGYTDNVARVWTVST